MARATPPPPRKTSPKPPANRLFHHLRTPLVRAVGPVTDARIEPARDPARVDHVWITIEPLGDFPLLLAVNTLSIKNQAAGYDDRLRLGRVRSEWHQLPANQIEECPAFSYRSFEETNNVFYETLSCEEMENLLLQLANDCLKCEVWGTPYRRDLFGLHQIHSRAPSCAVPEGLTNRDGALRFYLPHHHAILLLLKFCGQS